jgi:hypothetical protein
MSEQNANASLPVTSGPTRLPTIQELFDENLQVAGRMEGLNAILQTPPPAKWVKKHPYLDNWFYLPIDKVEHLLARIFKKYRIEILREGTSFNGVYVVVRVFYLNPATGEMDWHDGIGAAQLQTKKGTSPADLANVNNGAIAMAFPIAKTLAIKDACDHFGPLFGANLNRKDVVALQPDLELIKKQQADRHEKAMG